MAPAPAPDALDAAEAAQAAATSPMRRALTSKLSALAAMSRTPSSPQKSSQASTVLVETVSSPGLSPATVELTLDTTGQFTLSWSTPIRLAAGTKGADTQSDELPQHAQTVTRDSIVRE